MSSRFVTLCFMAGFTFSCSMVYVRRLSLASFCRSREYGGRFRFSMAVLFWVGVPSWMSGGTSIWELVTACWVDGEDWDCGGKGGTRASEDESLYGTTRSMGEVGNKLELGVNHMGWYCLRAKVASIMSMVWWWVVVYRTIFNDKGGVWKTGIERSIWVSNVSIVIWCWIEDVEKLIVSLPVRYASRDA